ncbi:hypothetical protein BS47DRAFT_1156946 [Hydnum rufescens UP504]|uniref:BTB domain-containing protein n=1 Tax=Hydnum rufescens UP504 TaxID=1448309 RepID=A0A9P6DZI5_9AGAM|nr:hypothetical protein BS47DRAFT_1156946 [Hydnum rufescens UP504]
MALNLPQPPIENDSKPPVPTIEMDDDPWALDVVLRWIYPLRNGPVVPSMEKALSVYLLADKLDVGCAVEAASKLLSHYLAIEGNPLRSWAISLHYGLEEARVAEKRFVTSHYSEIVGRPDELAYVNGLQYFDLLDARKKAWAAMREGASQHFPLRHAVLPP